MKRYLILLAVTIALGVIALLAGRSLRSAPAQAHAPAASPEVALDLTVGADGRLTPAIASVPKDHVVKLTVSNHGSRPAMLTLAGYEEHLGVVRVAPDSTWRGTFVADRPGEDFAWQLDGAPAARFVVTGSHLVEGHR